MDFEPNDEFETMLQYEGIDISEGIDIHKTNASKEYMLCHYWYFKDVRFKFEPRVCNKCSTGCRHLSQVTKSRISKNLNLRKKANRNFRRTFLKNRFRHLKFYSNPQVDWLEVVVIWTPFERRKIEVHIFERANLSGFGT